MNRFALAGFVIVVMAPAVLAESQPAFQLPKPQKEHAWLGQLAGEWESEGRTFHAPDSPPMKFKGRESVRKIGGFWIMAENKSEFMGVSFTGILTLGYDAQKKQYVGTWVDSMTHQLWTYEGSVDKSGKVLTLNTNGPDHTDPTRTVKFKEVIEIKSKDHKTFTSSMQGKDGKWTTLMTIDYRRKK